MDKLLIIIISSAFIFISCTPKNTGIISNQNCYEKSAETWVVCDAEKKYTYKYPAWIKDDGSETSGVNVFTYNDSSCPFPGILSEKFITIGDSKAIWGKADFADKYSIREMLDEDKPFCLTPRAAIGVSRKYVECEETDFDMNGCARKNREYEIEHGMYSAYAFCAEKDGKAVAICIQQMTDDEELAKQIFESFRWTD